MARKFKKQYTNVTLEIAMKRKLKCLKKSNELRNLEPKWCATAGSS